MEAFFLNGKKKAGEAFELKPFDPGSISEDEVLIETEAFGLNFADVMSRLGLYREAPPFPFVPGYEICGRVKSVGKNVSHVIPGDRVLALTRFGGYSRICKTRAQAVKKIPESWTPAFACALGTQACTAIYMTHFLVHLKNAKSAVVSSPAGGVGSLLVQIIQKNKIPVTGYSGHPEKFSGKEPGMEKILNYKDPEFREMLSREFPDGVDLAFDAVGGKTFKAVLQHLRPGGSIVAYGAASRAGGGGLFPTLKLVFGMGFTHPVFLLMKSRSICGLNMLKVGDRRPDILEQCLNIAVEYGKEGVLKPLEGKTFSRQHISDAHAWLESGRSSGKTVVTWDSEK
jgi:NADPH:quinone reductase-like Zn-dependent oxidoreductase